MARTDAGLDEEAGRPRILTIMAGLAPARPAPVAGKHRTGSPITHIIVDKLSRVADAISLCMDMRKLVGRNAARLRKAAGLTQEQLAERPASASNI